MGRYSGKIGYGISEEDPPNSGVNKMTIIERDVRGDVTSSGRRFEGEQVNDNIVMDNVISVVADAFARDNYSTIKYISWNGANWKVTSVQIQRPRLILRLGEVYRGQTP